MDKLVKGLRVFLGYMWLLLGVAKTLGGLLALITGEALFGTLFPDMMTELADTTYISFYQQIAYDYYVPYAAFFVLLAGLIEWCSAVQVLKGGKLVKWGFVGIIFMTLLYLPLNQQHMIGNIFSIVLYIWLMTKEYEDNLLQNLLDKLKRKK